MLLCKQIGTYCNSSSHIAVRYIGKKVVIIRFQQLFIFLLKSELIGQFGCEGDQIKTALMSSISTLLLLAAIFTTESRPIAPDRSVDDQMIGNVNRSAMGDHICSSNPCHSGGFCVKCHVDSGTCRTDADWQKGFACHCQSGFIGEFCEVQIRVRRSRDSKKIPQAICVTNDTCGKFGSCLPKPNSPDFECICDDAHMGSKCEYNKVAVACGAVACGCCGLGGLACNCGGGGDCPNDCNCDCPADCNCDCPAICVGCNCADCCKPDEEEDEQQPQVPITSPPETSTV